MSTQIFFRRNGYNISFSPFTVCNFITRINFTTFDTFTVVEPKRKRVTVTFHVTAFLNPLCPRMEFWTNFMFLIDSSFIVSLVYEFVRFIEVCKVWIYDAIRTLYADFDGNNVFTYMFFVSIQSFLCVTYNWVHVVIVIVVSIGSLNIR